MIYEKGKKPLWMQEADLGLKSGDMVRQKWAERLLLKYPVGYVLGHMTQKTEANASGGL